MEKKLVPYSIYLPADYIEKLKVMAKERQASSRIRDAIGMMLDGDNDQFESGYRKGIKDAIAVIDKNKECEMIAVKGRILNDILIDQLKAL
jgi:hypothetical protein